MTLGLTIGKFYPYHKGHQYLIGEAERRCDHLVVIVCGRSGEVIAGEVRASWVAADNPNVEVIYTAAELEDAPEPWAYHSLELLEGRVPDVVFTSEEYGDPWAEAIGLAAGRPGQVSHVCVDRDRRRFPVSGTGVRADLERWWEYLPAVTRAGLIPRVVICGAESTGTTTLAEALAAKYQTVWVPEYGRTWWEGRSTLAESAPWDPWEFFAIAEGQAALEDRLAAKANRVLICDTDPLVTTLFQLGYTGESSREIMAFAETRRPAAYILTGDEIPYEDTDGRKGFELRAQMQQWLREALTAAGVSWCEVRGSVAERVEVASQFIEKHAPLPVLSEPRLVGDA